MAAFFRAVHLALLCVSLPALSVFAADPSPEAIKKLEKELTGAKMTGQFTVTGKMKDDKLSKEEYTIESAKKLDEGDLWLIKARIKYGDKDSVFPVPVEIRWAGDTPVFTLDKVAIPGLGTFSSRVIIYDGKYAGTWQHDQVGGHLFGTIGK